MNIIDIIVKKKNKQELTYEEIEYFINAFMKNEIKDYQISSLLMAIVINGMTLEETSFLTDIMIKSGDLIDLELGDLVDKHSTGVHVAKMSGRGLGHTGGTIDKLESIDGFKVELTKQEFISQVNKIGVSVISQTGNIAPADKKLYALRDVTGTTESIPLIASSIMSKKIASGAKYIVVDVKVGNGALIKNISDAKKLSEYMIHIGKKYERKVVCVLTNMDYPLGNNIGNGLEVIESINCLKGNGPKDLEKLVIKLGTLMVSLAKKVDIKEAEQEIKENLTNNKAYLKFEEFVKAQSGDLNKIEISNRIFSIKSNKEGFINHIDTFKLGEIVKNIGGGRQNKEDTIDYGVGIVLNKKTGDLVFENEEILKIYLNKKDVKISEVLDCFVISDILEEKQKLILDIIE